MTLYVVATPLGNLKDFTIRAKEIFEEATLVLAEDTRNTRKLFQLLGIPAGGKTFIASHAQSSDLDTKKTLLQCEKHNVIVLVSDAGTPAISDPGSFFVDQFRVLYPDSFVIPVPGPSAVVSALSVSGFPASHFEFLGFIPHKKGRQTLFQKIAATKHTMVVYESPHRILKTLQSLAEVIGDRSIMVGREMTKQFEEYPRGSARYVFDYFATHKEKIKGEFVIVIGPSTTEKGSILV